MAPWQCLPRFRPALAAACTARKAGCTPLHESSPGARVVVRRIGSNASELDRMDAPPLPTVIIPAVPVPVLSLSPLACGTDAQSCYSAWPAVHREKSPDTSQLPFSAGLHSSEIPTCPLAACALGSSPSHISAACAGLAGLRPRPACRPSQISDSLLRGGPSTHQHRLSHLSRACLNGRVRTGRLSLFHAHPAGVCDRVCRH